MLPASTVPQSGQVLVSHHCRVSSMTYSLHLNMMIRQMVSRGLVYPLRVSRLTYTAPEIQRWHNETTLHCEHLPYRRKRLRIRTEMLLTESYDKQSFSGYQKLPCRALLS